jgi:pyruvate dehydrogenase E2 component (dihydrolipoamide acetyltransferase)
LAELVTMPKMGFDMAEGVLVEWAKEVGDQVSEGEVLAIIETDKANVEVTAFKGGVLRQILVDAGAVVPVGKAIAIIGGADEEIDQADFNLEAEPAKEKPPTPEAAEKKTTEVAESAEQTAPPEDTGRILASPVARRMAEELGIDLVQVTGSGPGGRITKRDVETHVQKSTQAPETPTPPRIPTPSYEPSGDEFRAEPLSPMRRTISRRMTESKQQAPHFYVTIDVDMAAAMNLRKQLNQLVQEDEKISVNDLIVKACAVALRQYPHLNASFAGDEIHIHNRINVGVAVALEAGLITTVIKDCDRKPLAQISRETRELIERARQGRMAADDIVGGTFTISNLGMYGVEDFVAIINPPQAAILAVGAVRQTAVVDEQGQLTVGTRMKITVSADHRVTDGAEAASFLRTVQGILEEPMRLLL